MSDRFKLDATVTDKLLEQLGVSRGQFVIEVERFELSPKEWFEARLRALGWVPPEDAMSPPRRMRRGLMSIDEMRQAASRKK